MTRMMMAKGDSTFGNRLDDLTRAFQEARNSTISSRLYNQRYLTARANTTELQPGDHVVLKVGNREGLTSRWDPQWMVTRTNGPATYIYQLQTGLDKVVNRDKLLRVNPDIVWDEVNPRPRRAPRHRRVGAIPLAPNDPMNEAGENERVDDPEWIPPPGMALPAPRAPDLPVPLPNNGDDMGLAPVPPPPIAGGGGEAQPPMAAEGEAPQPPEAPPPQGRGRREVRPSARARANLDRRDLRDPDLQRMFIRKQPAERSPSPQAHKKLRTQEMIHCIELVRVMC